VASFGATGQSWLETDENEEAIAALEFLAEITRALRSSAYHWKWIIIVLHNAIQCFMVIALRQSDGRGPIQDKCMAKIIQALDRNEMPPREKLDDFMTLHKKIKTPERMRKYGRSKHLNATADEDLAMEKLNDLRNEFLHFTPRGWSLEVTGAPTLCLRCLRIVDFLVSESGTILWYEKNQRSRYDSSKTKLFEEFRALETAMINESVRET
jgi:hypothetical protein